jgi:2-polyprenyl-6-methoxyphenol hydroxylase-like FAD-dependent oxidoreductase
MSNSRAERDDLLVGADGIHSRVRDVVFGAGFERALGGYYIAITQTLRHGLPPVIHSYLGVGKIVNLLPVASDSVSAVIYVGANAGANLTTTRC